MDWLNYHHLLYFWVVAREGSIARAAAHLGLAQPTISAQIHTLERALGERLFEREGRRLVLTDTGRVALDYASEIFTLGRELLATVKGQPTGRPLVLIVGLTDALPKLIAYRLLEPVLHLKQPVRLVCQEDRPERLLARLSVHELDLVLADAPAEPGIKVRTFHHLLGECGVSFFAAPALAVAHRRGFPRSLDRAPLLLPRENSTLRLSLERWFDERAIRPRIVGEFDDSALLKVFGQAGVGIFAAPTLTEREIRHQHRVELLGRAPEVRERFYAISVHRKLTHPMVRAIYERPQTAAPLRAAAPGRSGKRRV